VSFVAFHYRSYGTFFYTKKGSIISTVDLPTTEIIEPNFIKLKFCENSWSGIDRYLLINQIDYRNNYRKSSGERWLLYNFTDRNAVEFLRLKGESMLVVVLFWQNHSWVSSLLFHYILPKNALFF
jgi:hypothetical protein